MNISVFGTASRLCGLARNGLSVRSPNTASRPKEPRSACHVDTECGLSRVELHAAETQFADPYSRRRRLADHRQDAAGAGRSQGPYRKSLQEIWPGLSHPSVRRNQPLATRARGERARAARPGKTVFLDARMGPDPGATVSARP